MAGAGETGFGDSDASGVSFLVPETATSAIKIELNLNIVNPQAADLVQESAIFMDEWHYDVVCRGAWVGRVVGP